MGALRAVFAVLGTFAALAVDDGADVKAGLAEMAPDFIGGGSELL